MHSPRTQATAEGRLCGVLLWLCLGVWRRGRTAAEGAAANQQTLASCEAEVDEGEKVPESVIGAVLAAASYLSFPCHHCCPLTLELGVPTHDSAVLELCFSVEGSNVEGQG